MFVEHKFAQNLSLLSAFRIARDACNPAIPIPILATKDNALILGVLSNQNNIVNIDQRTMKNIKVNQNCIQNLPSLKKSNIINSY